MKRLFHPIYVGAFIATAITAVSPVAELRAAEKPVVPDNVKNNIMERVAAGDTVAVVVGIVTPDGTAFFSHNRKVEGDPEKFDEQTIFEIGSISKVFTAMLLADSVRRGEVALDDRVDKFLPVDVAESLRKLRPITLKDLAMHRSGLPRMPNNLLPKDPDDPYVDYGPQAIYEFLRSWPGPTDPEPGFSYSNLGSGLLGHVLTLVAKKNYEELLTARITKPLALNDTGLALSASQKKRLAAGHDGDKVVKGWNFDVLAGAGAIRSSVADMLRFLSAFLGTAPPELLADAKAMLAIESPTGRGKDAVALAWIIDRKHGNDVIWHNGGTGGYHSFCGFRPDTKTGVVVLTNSTHDIDDIGMHILEPKNELKVPEKRTKVAADKLERLVGYYELQPGIVFQITREGEALFAQLTGQGKLPVFPSSETKFFYKAVDAQLTFDVSDKGEVAAVTLHQSGRDTRARKLGPDYKPAPPPTEVPVDPKVLQAYVGKYSLAGGRATIEVRLKDAQLSVQMTGQPQFLIFAESDSKFFLKVVEAKITFVKDDAGKVTHLILHQGGMDQKATRQE